ncbi:oligosaccharide flippase family protein [Pigmentiphaga sp.]|uniref:oligosaccharide flippase family protein n=1 Tax=Pigmentiphaga sp. TaxID=1977564 RepID=UPI00128B194A|nr:oligosaccharide flippase family protein [Pigmentiphaga sp.]
MASFKKKIRTLLAGNVSAQLILALGSIPLARLYTPDQFGIFGVILSSGMILSHLATLSLENTFMLSRSRTVHSSALFAFLGSFTLLATGILLVGLFVSGRTIHGTEISLGLLVAIVFSTFFYSLYKVCTQYQLAMGDFKRTSSSKLIQSLSVVLLQLVLFGAQSGLILGYLAGLFISVIAIWPRSILSRRPNRLKFSGFLRKYRNFPFYHMPASFFAALSSNILIFILSYQFNLAAVGHYLMAHRIVSIPITYLTTSIGQAYYSEITKSDANVAQITENLATRSWLYASPIFLIFLLCSEVGFQFFFGDEWRESGHIAAILTPWLLISFVTGPLSYIFPATGNQRLDFLLTILIFSLRVSGVLLGGMTGNFQMAILGFSAFGSLSLAIYSFFIFRTAGSGKAKSLKLSVLPLAFFWLIYLLAEELL